jgi:hypothetical protein
MTEAERHLLGARIESVIMAETKRLELERPAADRTMDQRAWEGNQTQFGVVVDQLESGLSPETLRRAKAVLGATVLNPC